MSKKFDYFSVFVAKNLFPERAIALAGGELVPEHLGGQRLEEGKSVALGAGEQLLLRVGRPNGDGNCGGWAWLARRLRWSFAVGCGIGICRWVLSKAEKSKLAQSAASLIALKWEWKSGNGWHGIEQMKAKPKG
jgi:hypothetical protein